jgi:DNA-binding transcriptional ArsR family regulator
MARREAFLAQHLLRIDSLLVDRVRLAIMAALTAAEEPLEFTELLTTLELTRGNLAGHLRKLEDGYFVEVHKEFVGRKPRTTYRCTSKGREEFAKYISQMEAMIKGLR